MDFRQIIIVFLIESQSIENSFDDSKLYKLTVNKEEQKMLHHTSLVKIEHGFQYFNTFPSADWIFLYHVEQDRYTLRI